SEVNRSHMDAFKDAILAYAVYYPVVEILSSIAVASIVWFGGLDVIRGLTTLGVLVAFMQYAQRFFRPIQDLSEKYNILQSAMASSERVFKLLDTPVEITSPAITKSPAGPGRIEFDHVWFAYRNIPMEVPDSRGDGRPRPSGRLEEAAVTEPDWVLRDVSFRIEPGETIAVVGHTGAGKTTLTSLLLRFYDVQRGSVTIADTDVRAFDLTELRRNFGVVLQDPHLFTGTIATNIRLGTAGISDEELARAAERVNLLDFIARLPERFAQPVRERGAGL